MLAAIIAALHKFHRDARGATSLEFALVAIPTFMLLFGTLEFGLMIFESSIVEGATREAARKVRTGAAQISVDPTGTFKTAFCANLFSAYDCSTFSFDVRNFADFPNIVLPAVTFNQAGMANNVVFQPGGAGTVTTVRVIHQHVFATPLI
ncbi:MAG: pilus assembly protein, partial [Rhodospirillaceae bacterium]|nr:pilus assembly protein [Rhodospirillaceae bacterium]